MRRLATMMVLTGLFLCGCGKAGPEPSEISGTVTFDGKPIIYGQLELVPDTEKQMSGPAGNVDIVDGKFDSRLGGRGVYLGSYKAKVTAWEAPLPPSSNDETVVSNTPSPIFTGYVLDVTIKAEGNVIEIPAAAKGFGLSGKKRLAAPSNDP